jgi:predicted nuclease of predicted toxin-antitoxin system
VDFYLDENVSDRMGEALERRGHDVLITRNLRSVGVDDARQLANAARLGRLLVTHNRRDFVLLHRAWRRWSHDWEVGRYRRGRVTPVSP